MKIDLHRSYFATNSMNESEFDYLLALLGFPEAERDDISMIEISVESSKKLY